MTCYNYCGESGGDTMCVRRLRERDDDGNVDNQSKWSRLFLRRHAYSVKWQWNSAKRYVPVAPVDPVLPLEPVAASPDTP